MARDIIGPEPRPESESEDELLDDSRESRSPPSLEEQKNIIKEQIDKTPKLGELWYLICAKWFDQWKALVQFDSTTPNSGIDSTQDKTLPPIDNLTFLDDVKAVAENKREEGVYFQLLPEDAWKFLKSWYGGGPDVPRKVLKRGTSVAVQLYPLFLKIVDAKSSSTFSDWFNPMDSLQFLQNEGAKRLRLDPQSIQMYVTEDRNKTVLNELDTLIEEHVRHKQEIFFETKSDSSFRKLGGYSSWYSSNGSPGLVGLNNLGNTCFMNSALQCLSHTLCLTEYFRSGYFKYEINQSNPLGSGGQIAESYYALLGDLWGNLSSVAPRDFKSKLERFAPQFSGYQQHDSQELLAYLLDGLHEDLNRIVKKPYTESKEAEGRPDDIVAKEAWDIHKRRNDSIVVDWFHGQLKSTLVCPDENCKKHSVTFDPFMYLSLPLPINNTRLINIKIFFKDPTKSPVEVTVTTNKYCPISDFKKDISAVCQIPGECLVIADVFNSRIFKVFSDASLVDSIQSGDVIFVFEIEPKRPLLLQNHTSDSRDTFQFDQNGSHRNHTDENNFISVRIVHLREERTRNLFGDPLVISVPSPISYEKLTKLCAYRLQSLFKNYSEVEKHFSELDQLEMNNKQREPKEQDQTQPMDTSDSLSSKTSSSSSEEMDVSDHSKVDQTNSTEDDSQVPKSTGSDDELNQQHNTSKDSSPSSLASKDETNEQDPEQEAEERKEAILTKYFTIRPVDQYGSLFLNSRGSKTFNLTEEIHFMDQDTIGIFWTPEGLENHFDNYEKPRNAGATGDKKEEVVSLEECINLFTKTEKLGPEDPWYCNKCKEFQQATKKFDIWSLPKILIIHLKRFSYRNKWHREKLETLVDFPFENLDMSKYLLSAPEVPLIYDLYAISNHYGALGGGHYTAYCLQDGKWYKFDDSHVSEMSQGNTKTSAAYVLFYQRRQTEEEKRAEEQELRRRFAELEKKRQEEEARRIEEERLREQEEERLREQEDERLREQQELERERQKQQEGRSSDEQEHEADEEDEEDEEEDAQSKDENETRSEQKMSDLAHTSTSSGADGETAMETDD